VLAADLAASRLATGGSLLDALDELAVAHGLYLTDALSVRMSVGRRDAVLRRLAELRVEQRPAPDVFVLLGARTRAVIRPSGTEPKLKAYLQVTQPVAETAELPEARAHAERRLAALRVEIADLLGVPPAGNLGTAERSS
jgi:phosphomannomutase